MVSFCIDFYHELLFLFVHLGYSGFEDLDLAKKVGLLLCDFLDGMHMPRCFLLRLLFIDTLGEISNVDRGPWTQTFLLICLVE